jgi:purine-binding chemotaxis protein CheW
VLFSLNKQLFGIDTEIVSRVINLERLLKTPDAPDFIAGIITIEGELVVVIDLAYKIAGRKTIPNYNTKVIILNMPGHDHRVMVGVLIDDVHNVLNIDESKLLAAAHDAGGIDANPLDGMYKIEDDFYIIMDSAKVFEKELVIMRHTQG